MSKKLAGYFIKLPCGHVVMIKPKHLDLAHAFLEAVKEDSQ